jgi:hypothetical protein
MTPEDFASNFVDLYRYARALSVPSPKVTRARSRSVSSDLEELVAAYVAANSDRDLHIYVDQPVSLGDGKVAYPDLVILDLASQTVIAIVDVKTDIGWKRDGMQAMCEKLSKVRQALTTIGTVNLGPEPKLRAPHMVAKNLSCHLVVGALENSGKDLQTPESMKLAKDNDIQVHVLVEGRHPNHFSRQQLNSFPGMKVRIEDFAALARLARAA